jgi:hypothetical protein
MTDDAARITELALVQVERVDRLVSTVAQRLDETVTVVQTAFARPIRQGATLMAAFRAVAAAIQEWKRRTASANEDEDPLFVG